MGRTKRDQTTLSLDVPLRPVTELDWTVWEALGCGKALLQLPSFSSLVWLLSRLLLHILHQVETPHARTPEQRWLHVSDSGSTAATVVPVRPAGSSGCAEPGVLPGRSRSGGSAQEMRLRCVWQILSSRGSGGGSNTRCLPLRSADAWRLEKPAGQAPSLQFPRALPRLDTGDPTDLTRKFLSLGLEKQE